MLFRSHAHNDTENAVANSLAAVQAGVRQIQGTINKRVVGIKLGAYNNEINHVKLGPAQSVYHSIHEVYYVTISSLKYIGGMILGKADTSQLEKLKV